MRNCSFISIPNKFALTNFKEEGNKKIAFIFIHTFNTSVNNNRIFLYASRSVLEISLAGESQSLRRLSTLLNRKI